MNLKITISIALICMLTQELCAQDKMKDSLQWKKLPDITVVGRNSKSDYQQLPEIVGTTIYAGKKNALIVLENVQGNIANNTMRQVLAKVPGIHVWESDPSGIQIGIAARGLSPNRSWEFNVRQNGYDIAADPFGYPEAYYNPQLQAVQRIEIVRGQGALQYGPQFGGMVNYILKDGNEINKQDISFSSAWQIRESDVGIWVATNNIGLLLFKSDQYNNQEIKGSPSVFSLENRGLASNRIAFTLEDSFGRFWVSHHDEGIQVFEANDPIIIKLKERGSWIKTEQYIHNYPHCWRTAKPVLYYPLDSWFVRSTASKDRMIELNKTNPKPILIDVYTDWCGFCKKMDKETYANNVIANYINEHFYAIKLNGEGKEDIKYKGHTYKFKQQGRILTPEQTRITYNTQYNTRQRTTHTHNHLAE